MIEVIIYGGLGNQMFEYACARAYAVEKKDDLILNTSFFNGDRFQRQFSLLNFNIPNNVLISKKKRKYLRLLSVFCKIGKNFFNRFFALFGIYLWKDSRFKRINVNHRKSILYGYFQSHHYFEQYSDIIKKDFKCVSPLSDGAVSLLKRIKKTDSVCVHVRRDDYVSEGLLVCDINYYLKACSFFLERSEKHVFYIFSDDIEWTKKNLIVHNAIYVDEKHEDYEDLELMRNCKHFIISNSTFSWWAQYLCEYNDKIVVAPKKWDKKGNPNDIYMSSWILF